MQINFFKNFNVIFLRSAYQPIPDIYVDQSSTTTDSKPRRRFISQKSTDEPEDSKDANTIAADTLLQVH